MSSAALHSVLDMVSPDTHTQPAQLHSNNTHTPAWDCFAAPACDTQVKKSQMSFLSVTLAVTPLTLRYAELTQTSACGARPFKIKASQGLNLQVTTFFFSYNFISIWFFFLEDFLFFKFGTRVNSYGLNVHGICKLHNWLIIARFDS